MKLADRMSRLGTETAFVVLARAKQLEAQGRDIIHLEIGEPDFDTPANIVNAAIDALQTGWTHYGPSAGLLELREAVAEEFSRTRAVKVDPDHVVITPGGKPVMFFTMMALLNDGDEVIYPNPGFPIYESVINFVGARPVPIKLHEGNCFRLDIDELKSLVTSRTRMIVINSPHNPTGSVLSRDDLARIAEIAVANDIVVLSDEIYSRIIYASRHHSIFSLDGMQEHTIVLDGYSKTYAMTGWRLGYGIMPPQLASRVAQLQTNCNSCTATFSQRAGIEALRGPQAEVDRMVDEFRKRRDIIVAGLNKIDGIRCHMPEGAFYVFPNISALGLRAHDLGERILSEAGVAVLAGTSFGTFGEGFIRLSYANSIENIRRALTRLGDFVEKL